MALVESIFCRTLEFDFQLKPIVNLNTAARTNGPWITVLAAGMGSA
jgi:hypothetical protein